MDFRKAVRNTIYRAGVEVDGKRPWDLRVRRDRFFHRVFLRGSLGLGESYMDGDWECDAIDEMVARLFRAEAGGRLKKKDDPVRVVRARLFNLQKKSRAFNIGRRHYDIGNDLYEKMLDRRMIYSCALWDGARDLDEAQEKKLDLVCRKLGLEPGMKLLDIGCGWGGLACFAAEKYGVEVVGVTVSRAQAELARERCRGLPVEIRLEDYRNMEGCFDRVVSIGMFEHVGYKNYRTFFRKVREVTAEGGLFLLHTIGANRSVRCIDPWIDRYIFPDAMLPSPGQLGRAAEGLMVMEDWQNIGPNYDRTLMAWWENCEKHWPELASRYDGRFRRMWRFYLLSCAGSFRARRNQVWQIVFSPSGVCGGYCRP